MMSGVQRSTKGALMGAAVLFMLVAEPLLACSVCHGDPESEMVKGAKAGVIFLAIVAYGVLMTMAGVAGFWIVRARRVAAQDQIEPPVESPPDA